MRALLCLVAFLDTSQGEIRLPLPDYLALMGRVARADDARAVPTAASLSEIVSQRETMTVDGGFLRSTATFEASFLGSAPVPLVLPVTGIVQRTEIDPPLGAAVDGARSGLILAAFRPGRYRVTVVSRAPLTVAADVSTVTLAPAAAAVHEATLDLPRGDEWRSPVIVSLGETRVGSRRHVRLTWGREKPALLELRRPVPTQAEETLSRASVVTLVHVDRDGVRRRDVVLYDVERGVVERHVIGIPEGLEVEEAATERGPAAPLVEEGRLTVARTEPLRGAGHVVIIAAPRPLGSLSLAPVVPDGRVRARYLAVSTDLATPLAPSPKHAWARLDVADLPETVRAAAPALDIVAVWQQTEDTTVSIDVPPLTLAVEEAPPLWARETTTLLTAEGTLLHRDRLTVRDGRDELSLTLVPGSVLWSTLVDGAPVKPRADEGRLVVPLPRRTGGERVIEVVSVRERAFDAQDESLPLVLPVLERPVLSHHWRLLLPATHRYRLAGSDLDPASSGAAAPPAPAPTAYVAPIGRDVQSLVDVLAAGGSIVRGHASDDAGGDVPGVSITVTGPVGTRKAITDVQGTFLFMDVPPGEYRLECEATGFTSLDFPFRVVRGRAALPECRMLVASVREEVTVVGEAPQVGAQDLAFRLHADEADRRDAQRAAEAARDAAVYRDEAAAFRQGLVGGVRPIPIVVPETGRLIALAGALPPPAVQATFDVKRAR